MSTASAEYEYFTVWPEERVPGRKTRNYAIIAKGGGFLGYIKWYGPWRQFCFFPEEGSVWSAGCLNDVKDYLARLQDERKRT